MTSHTPASSRASCPPARERTLEAGGAQSACAASSCERLVHRTASSPGAKLGRSCAGLVGLVPAAAFGERMDTAVHMLRTGRRGTLFEFHMAFEDFRGSLRRLGLAWSLAWHDVVARYRGSILGPFWITLSMGLMVLGIGLVYARLFGIGLHDFLPLVALGIVFFGAISGMITEGCDTFVSAKNMLSQTSLPMFTFLWRTVLRTMINLGHHLVIVVAVLLVYGYWRVLSVPGAVIGLIFLFANAA